MSKTNTEAKVPETPAHEGKQEGLQLDVRVRPIAPMGNLLAFGDVTTGGWFKIDGFLVLSGDKGR